MGKLPTSTTEEFREQLLNPNRSYAITSVDDKPGEIAKVQKNIVLSYASDSTGCGHIRCVFPMTYLNSLFGKSKRFNIMIAPNNTMILQNDILLRTRSIFFQRTMSPNQIDLVKQYKSLQPKYAYMMKFDIDDFIWKGTEEGECIPEYNFGSGGITDDVRNAAIEIMNLMDLVCVSTDFLGEYIKSKGVKTKIITIPNTVPQYFWGNQKRKPIKEKIIKPKVIYSGSPTHYSNEKRLAGDWDNAWLEWILRNVKNNKIEFFCMGGLPFFFEEIKNKIKIIQWVNSYQYHLPIKNFRPDFGIAPLVPNFFNYSKSDLRAIEYYSVGALCIGSVFDTVKSPKCWNKEHAPSPYDNIFLKLQHNCSVKDIDELFWKYTEPDYFNDILAKQYKFLYDNSRYLESEKSVKRYTDIL
jgi:hypothetical protein